MPPKILPSGLLHRRRADLRSALRFQRISTGLARFCGVLALVCAASVHAAGEQAPSARQLAHTVDEHYNHLSSLVTRFTERYRGMGLDRTESGTLTLRKPGRMRWAYDAPAGKLFVLNGKEAISYTPGDAEANRMPARQLDDLRSPLRFLLGHTELSKELDHLTVAPVAEGYSLAGAPHGLSQRLRQVTLVVTPQGVIRSLQLDEVDGSITSFVLSDQRENLPVPDADFTFTPPAGVSIVNGPAPI